MLSHNSSTPVTHPYGKREVNNMRLWRHIEATLQSKGPSSVADLAVLCHHNVKRMRTRLEELRSIGQVRHSTKRGYRNCTLWELGADPTYSEDDRPLFEPSKPAPFIARRDPLVAALFGMPAQSVSKGLGE